MIGGFGPAPYSFGGGRPIVAAIYDSLQEGLPSALRGGFGTYVDLETYVHAQMIATAWDTEDRRVSNSNPFTSGELLGQWCKRLGVNPQSFSSFEHLRSYLAFGDSPSSKVSTRASLAQACHLAMGKIYGDWDRVRFFYHVTWFSSGDFDDLDSPADTYWYGNTATPPDGETWTTKRALVSLNILRLPSESVEEVTRMVRERLVPILDWMVPFWASYTWSISTWTPETYDSPSVPRALPRYGGLDLIAGRAPDLVIWGADLSASFPANSVSNYTEKVGSLPVTACTGFSDEQISQTYWRINDSNSAISIDGSSASSKTGLIVTSSYAGENVPLANLQLTVGFLYRALGTNQGRELFWAGELGTLDGYLMISKGASNQISARIGNAASVGIGTLPMAAGDLGLFVASVRQNGSNTELRCMIHKLGDALGSPTVSGVVSAPSTTQISKIDSIGLGCNGSNGPGGSLRPFRMASPMLFMFEKWGASQSEMAAIVAHVVNSKRFV